jgi:hypothetical protein
MSPTDNVSMAQAERHMIEFTYPEPDASCSTLTRRSLPTKNG